MLAEASGPHPTAGLRDLLSTVERDRIDRLRRDEDRRSRALAAAVLRLAVSAATGTPPREVVIERTCPTCGQPHWRPTLPGTGLHASISHAGDLVAVALTTAGPVGIDVERITDVDLAGLARLVLHPTEQAAMNGRTDFFRYWSRKEAVVKATGEGLAAGLSAVRISAPDDPPAVLAYPGREAFTAFLADLAPRDGYSAAVAVLVDREVRVVERDGTALIAAAAGGAPQRS